MLSVLLALVREYTSNRWISPQRANDIGLWCLLYGWAVEKTTSCRWFESDTTVMHVFCAMIIPCKKALPGYNKQFDFEWDTMGHGTPACIHTSCDPLEHTWRLYYTKRMYRVTDRCIMSIKHVKKSWFIGFLIVYNAIYLFFFLLYPCCI